MEVRDFFHEEHDSKYKWHWETTVCGCADTSNFQLRGDKTFLIKFG